MTDRIAVWLAAAIIAVIAADLLYFGWNLHLFLGRKLAEAIDFLAVWR